MISTIANERLGTIEDLKLFDKIKSGAYRYNFAYDFIAKIYFEAGE